ncbi:MAG: ATP-binding protein [Armatimonadetes bacterium]|nr:ATP-binding protein [Armatimonadota bacterium]
MKMTIEHGKPDVINATPTKGLFIKILSRDISVKACILDLIDNSVDAYIRNGITDRRKIRLNISKDKFEILDNCGGIEYNFLKDTVFRFGADIKRDKPTLGIYGIGMKRAILKMGKKIFMETDDGKSFSKIYLDVNEWCKSDNWEIPFEHFEHSRLSSEKKPYTKIVVTDLYDIIKDKFNLTSFINSIKDAIHITYTFFITDKIDFYLNNDVKIEPFIIEVRSDELYKPAKYQESFEDVDFEIICFIDPKEGRTKKELGKRGWNIFFNKRLILAEDTTGTTGWTGTPEDLPKYHSIYNEFRGIVFINSEDPSKLPLNTSKTGLDTETAIYDHIRNKMIKTSRPLINYLSRKYHEEKSSLDEIEEKVATEKINEIGEEEKAGKAKYVPLEKIEANSKFNAPPKPKPKEEMRTIKYKRPEKLVKKVKQNLKANNLKEVGEKTFDYYVELEEIEDE